MGNRRRDTTCGHARHHGKGLCAPCYLKSYKAANVERLREQQRVYRAANAERIAAVEKAWRDSNQERSQRVSRDWYLANRERVLAEAKVVWAQRSPEQVAADQEQHRAWAARNPTRATFLHRRGYARRRGAPDDLTYDQWVGVLAEFDGHCAYCQRTDLPLVTDHMTPISRGGLHTRDNIVPACDPCNSWKGTRTALEFAGQARVR